MRMRRETIIALLAGSVGGVGIVQTLHAQAEPKIYVVSEIDVTNQDAYMQEYSPLAIKLITAAGGTYLARGPQLSILNGTPIGGRVSVVRFDSIAKATALYNSIAYRDARAIGDKYAKIRPVAVQALP